MNIHKPTEVRIGEGVESLTADAAQGSGPIKGTISAQARRHNQIRRAVLKAHPEIKKLYGPDWRSAFFPPIILAIHWGIAWLVSGTNVLVVFLVAFFVGQLVVHSAGALLHDTAHKLIFRNRWAKLAFDINLELILGGFAKQLTYQHQHISSHHPYMGEYIRDYEHDDACFRRAQMVYARKHPVRQRVVMVLRLMVHMLPLGFMLDGYFQKFYGWATGMPVKDPKRAIAETKPPRREVWLFYAVSLFGHVFLFVAFGWLAWLYYLWSISLFVSKAGVTNLGQSLSEHPGDDEEKPTRSYYGRMNYILFNTGYHDEHHTFPNVAWSRLPAIRKIAPEFFQNETAYSYPGHWWRHLKANFFTGRQNKYYRLGPDAETPPKTKRETAEVPL